MTVHGADADELDRIATAFRQAADELDNEGGTMTRLLNNVSWVGDVAGSFVGSWSGVQLPKIGLSTRFLREAADDLTRNAAEQRRGSERSTGTIGTIGTITVRPNGDDPDVDWGHLKDVLEKMGLGPDLIAAIIEGFEEFLGPDQVKELLDNLLTPGLVTVLKGLDMALGIVDFIVDLGKDFADHPHLELEDRIRHAVIDGSIGVGIAKGVDAGITWAMAALGTLIPLPGAGTALGMVVGKVVGFVVGEGVKYGIEKADEHLDFKDSIADKGVDMLNWRDDLQIEIIENVIDAGADLIEAGADLVDDITDWIF